MPDDRRLTAIMFTDLVGYTTLMGRDEGEARALVERSRDHIKQFVARFEGEYLEEPGDSTLSSFSSAINATDCALAIQQSLADDSGLQLRIGVHLGDVVFANGHVYGDGVNVAARLEPLALPGGILVSGTVRDAVRGHPQARTHYLGRKRLKNVAERVRVYTLVDASNVSRTHWANGNRLSVADWLKPAASGATVLALGVLVWFGADRFLSGAGFGTGADATDIPEKSIAVLPFQNLSADQNNQYFVAGMQDMILTKLADIDDLKVISRSSTANYKSHPDNLKQVAAELGVATILEGSVQKQDNQVLINVQLIDARNDMHLWADSYHRTTDDIFGVEGEVAGKIATALHAELSPADTTHLAAAPTTDRVAYDLFLRAEYQANRARMNLDTARFNAAIPLYRQAIARDPDFALAYARLSFVESLHGWFGGDGYDIKQLFDQARADAERALELAPNLAAAHLALGYSEYYGQRDYAGALKAFAAALVLNPNDAAALEARGYVERRQNRFDHAIASFTQALARDPRNSTLAQTIGATCMMVSRYTDAERWYKRALAIDAENLLAKGSYASAILFRTGDVPRALTAAQGDAPVMKFQRVNLLTLQRKYGEAIALLKSIPDTPDIFNLFAGSKAFYLAYLHRLAGEASSARSLYAEALVIARAELDRQQGTTLASVWQNIAGVELGLGHTAEGLAAIARAQAIIAQEEDQYYRSQVMQYNAALYAMAERPDLAVPLLAKALATPGIGYIYSPVLLWLDPDWDPIRDEPAFQALLKQYAKYQPVVM